MLDPKIHHNNLLPSILAKIEANVAGADDALMLDDLGFIAVTNATHVFHVKSGVLRTSTTRACPEGITRECVLHELAPALGLATEVGDFSLTEIYNADEVFVSGTMGGLTPVLTIDGRTIGDGEPGPLTASVSAAYRDLQTSTGTVVS
jgi:branched-chain amino acid aminotransferase